MPGHPRKPARRYAPIPELTDARLLASAHKSARAGNQGTPAKPGPDRLPYRSYTSVVSHAAPCAWCHETIAENDVVSTIIVAGTTKQLHWGCATMKHLRLLGAV